MEYLKRVLGIEVLYENKALEHLPNFISTRYDSQKVSLSGQKAVFLYPKTELEQVETLKKHLERVKKVADCPVILVLEQITARQKEYLLREKIAFIVDAHKMSVYKTITNGGVALKLRVLNKGTAKATDIRISIVFPKDIFVYDIKKYLNCYI